MPILDSGVVTMLPRCSVALIAISDAGVVTMLPRTKSTVTDFLFVSATPSDLTTEASDTLTTEAGTTLTTEG